MSFHFLGSHSAMRSLTANPTGCSKGWGGVVSKRNDVFGSSPQAQGILQKLASQEQKGDASLGQVRKAVLGAGPPSCPHYNFPLSRINLHLQEGSPMSVLGRQWVNIQGHPSYSEGAGSQGRPPVPSHPSLRMATPQPTCLTSEESQPPELCKIPPPVGGCSVRLKKDRRLFVVGSTS